MSRRSARGIKPGVRVAIVGAGYIGLECAATFRKLGLDVTVIEMMDRVMNRVVAPEMSGFYQAEHASHGVKVLDRRKVSGLPRRRQRSRPSSAPTARRCPRIS